MVGTVRLCSNRSVGGSDGRERERVGGTAVAAMVHAGVVGVPLVRRLAVRIGGRAACGGSLAGAWQRAAFSAGGAAPPPARVGGVRETSEALALHTSVSDFRMIPVRKEFIGKVPLCSAELEQIAVQLGLHRAPRTTPLSGLAEGTGYTYAAHNRELWRRPRPRHRKGPALGGG